MSLKHISILLSMMSALTHSSKAATEPGPADLCRFIGFKDFTGFTTNETMQKAPMLPWPSTAQHGAMRLSGALKATGVSWRGPLQHGVVLLSPVIKAPMDWNELVVSWNADAPVETWLKVETRGIFPDHETKFYTMGIWSRDSVIYPRVSVRRQKDPDGTVQGDTLVLNRPGADVQLRLTLMGPGETLRPQLKYLGLSFLDKRVKLAALPPNRAVWGKIVTTTERSQKSYPQEKGWCSPTSLSMVLTRWSEVLHRPDLNVDVPEVAAGVYDDVFGGTGNWPFNTAYAGSFPGLRAYVARFSDISELEDWIAAGIPVIISARWDLLAPKRKPTGAGHLTVCIGFTKEGDVVINDPATNFKKHQKVRHIYTRQNVIKAWKTSHNTVYLVYPEKTRIPADRFGHWAEP
jgi:hypothetical protein